MFTEPTQHISQLIDSLSQGFTSHLTHIFTVRQMQQNFRVKGKKLYFGFVDLEHAFDRVSTEVIRLGIDDIILILQQNRLRWYGHVLRKELIG